MPDDTSALVAGGGGMERIIITIHPAPSDAALLRVVDAMQQVIDVLRIHEQAGRAMASPEESFEWKLESATTNSPFTVTALAEPRQPGVNVSVRARQVKAQVAAGIRDLMEHNEPSWWMGADTVDVIRDVFVRNQNGIGTTEIKSAPNETLAIGRIEAGAGLRAIAGITAVSVAAETPERRSWGEIQGVMVAAGRYYNTPAIQLKTEQYAFIWCRLSPALIERFGGAHRLTEVWDGRTIGVEGDLIYATGGKLSRIEATDIREIKDAPPIDLASVQDPNFTAGLDPVEYLRQLWEGSLAS